MSVGNQWEKEKQASYRRPDICEKVGSFHGSPPECAIKRKIENQRSLSTFNAKVETREKMSKYELEKSKV